MKSKWAWEQGIIQNIQEKYQLWLEEINTYKTDL